MAVSISSVPPSFPLVFIFSPPIPPTHQCARELFKVDVILFLLDAFSCPLFSFILPFVFCWETKPYHTIYLEHMYSYSFSYSFSFSFPFPFPFPFPFSFSFSFSFLFSSLTSTLITFLNFSCYYLPTFNFQYLSILNVLCMNLSDKFEVSFLFLTSWVSMVIKRHSHDDKYLCGELGTCFFSLPYFLELEERNQTVLTGLHYIFAASSKNMLSEHILGRGKRKRKKKEGR
ncbi:hypothetical protein QBC37DRAFT_104660 [Rhypophila decipiens]|uniref:Uncharacterized protein n=1 Tax=Rhypophila decipiens TaxID=261697 RepID=A0AAN6XYU6_9PEZI|nr:hypothetical protein QBC37DRAFT_104660 [Rhypophila decipiens]